MPDLRSAAEAVAIQIDEPIPLHRYHVSEGSEDRDGEHAEQI